MSIYRGAGGAGDAVADSSSEALLIRNLVAEAQVDADAAQASATAAASSASGASSSATAASTSATNAATSATNASNSASSASTSATNAASSASTATTKASEASTSATNAATSASGASTSATNAASSATTATTQATNASNSASAASTSATNASNSASAASTSASNASTSATSASGSASSATTSASNASTSATNAVSSAFSASTSASTATTQAGIATTKASEAATSASNASTSASTATTQASNASSSATSSANSATASAAARDAALAALDSFDDRYLGQKATAPTLDNDGNALVAGTLYFNTTTNEMKVYDGSTWLNAYASLSGALLATSNLSDLNNTATARTNLGVAIGTNVQAYDADLAAIAALSPTADNFIVGNGSAWILETPSQARTSLGLGTIATQAAPSGTVVGTSDTQTLTNKTIALGSNTVSGTLAQFNTAVTDADLVSLAGTETLTNKTLSGVTNTGNITFTGTGNRITGDMSNATVANRLMFQSSTTNGNTTVQTIPNGTSNVSGFQFFDSTDPTNAAFGQLIVVRGDSLRLHSNANGTASFLPITMNTGGSERLRIDTSGNVGIGTSSPATKLDVNGSASVTSFTGTTKLGITTRGSTGSTDYSGIDFIGNNQTNPVARIAALTTGGGSTLSFGTSNSYGSGITNTAMVIGSAGQIGIAGANYGTSGQVLTSGGSGSAPSWSTVSLPAGTVLQVVSASKTDTQSFAPSTSFSDITGLSVSITPRSSASKFLIFFSINGGVGTGDSGHLHVQLLRNGTAVGIADAASNRTRGSAMPINTSQGGQQLTSSNMYLDSPATSSAITYKMQIKANDIGSTGYVNRSNRDNDLGGYDGRGVSNITVMEVAG